MTKAPALAFAGLRVLIVEDDWFIAEDTADMVRGAGGEVVGPVPDVAGALKLIDEDGIAAALLDVDLGDETSFPIARRLVAAGIPFVFVSGSGPWRHLGAAEFADRPVLRKPINDEMIRRALIKD